MRPLLDRTAALTLLIGGLLSIGCCGPLVVGGCQTGCGEVYIDPWINEPPHDSCDSCGNFNGQSCGSCRPVFSGLATIWGYRYDGGCDSCGGLEPACGTEAGCGVEAGCGLEPTCGFELGHGGCDGCSSCSGGQTQYVESSMSSIPYGESVVELDPIEAARVVTPKARRVYRGGTNAKY